MWISGRRGDDDPERRRCVKANPVQKRPALRYTNRRLVPPPSLLRRETEEYDLGSYSGAWSSRSSLTLVKREPEELPPLRVVKGEPKTDAEPERQAGGVVGLEDFLPPAEADAIKAAILAHCAREEEEELQRRWWEEEIDTVLYEQGLAKALAFDEKEEEWRREKIEQEKIYVDLTSDED